MTQQRSRLLPVLRQFIPVAVLALGMVGLLSPQAARSADFTVEAQASEAWNFNTNPLMSLDQGKSIYGSVTRGALELKSSTPTTTLNFDAAIKQNIFNQSRFNTTDLHGGLDLSERIERWTAGVQGTTDYDTTRSSELTAYGTDVGNVRHLGLTVAPQIAFHPTLVDSVFLTSSAMTSRYDSAAYSDYYLISASPGYTHNFTPRDTGTFMVQFQRYHAMAAPRLTVDTISPTVGWATTLTPELTASATVGTQTSKQKSTTIGQKSWDWQYVFAANLAYQGEVDQMNFRATREQYPFGNGTQSLLTTFTATATHAISQSFALGLTASYQDATYQTTPDSIALRSLVSGGPNLTYRLTSRFDLSANYLYRRETLFNSDKTVQDHAATLNLLYHPPAWKL